MGALAGVGVEVVEDHLRQRMHTLTRTMLLQRKPKNPPLLLLLCQVEKIYPRRTCICLACFRHRSLSL